MSSTDRTSIPPLPPFLPPDPEPGEDVATFDGPTVPSRHSTLRCGCWLIGYYPGGSPIVAFDGTLRVECHRTGRSASGDLYQRPTKLIPSPPPRPPHTVLLPPPNPAAGIPILPRDRYRYYVRVTSLPEARFIGPTFTLAFELYRFTAPNAWVLEGARTAKMTRLPAPSGFPSASDYAEGDVKDAAGTVVARLKMGWVSKYFRKATVEIDTVTGSEQPTTSGAGHNWTTVGDSIGWQLNVVLSDTNVAEPSGAVLVQRRDARGHAGETRGRRPRRRLALPRPRGQEHRLDAARDHVRQRRHRLEQRAARGHRHRLALDHRRDVGHGRRAAVRQPRRRPTSVPRSTRSGTRWACSTTTPTSASCAPAT